MTVYSEKYLERKLRQEVEKHGGLAIKLVAVHFIGLPDRLCLLPGGRLFFAEIKTTGEKPTRLQLHVHCKLRVLGFNVHIIDTLEKCLSLI